MIRHNPFTPSDDVSCIAGLVSPRPWNGPGAAVVDRAGAEERPASSMPSILRSRLAEIVTRLADGTGRPLGAVAAEWFLRYLEQVVRPVLWLDGEAGIALEAHQQNTLLLLDGDGWPVGGRYRDNQGYYFRESRRADLGARLPGIGEHSDTFVSDDVTDERFAYYLAINNVLGLIGAFGSQGLADELLLLAAFRRFLEALASGPSRLRSSLPARLLDSPVLRCKANLLTRLHGLDELVGPVDTQSLYVTIANPFVPDGCRSRPPSTPFVSAEHAPSHLLRGAAPCRPSTPVPARAVRAVRTRWICVCRTASSRSLRKRTRRRKPRQAGDEAGARRRHRPSAPRRTVTTCSIASVTGGRPSRPQACSTSSPSASSGTFH